MSTSPRRRPPAPHKRSHAWVDARSLALAQAIAAGIRSDPLLIRKAADYLERQKKRRSDWPRAFEEWEEILAQKSVDEVLSILVEESEEGRRLRQTAPFAGVLSPAQRKEIFDLYETIGT